MTQSEDADSVICCYSGAAAQCLALAGLILPRSSLLVRTGCGLYTLDRWGAAPLINDAVLVVDELVTNAVKATGVMDEHVRWTELTRIEFITVRMLGFETSIRVEVWDSAPNLPALPQRLARR